jgi:hypothetical protein
MPPALFEPTVPASERPQTHALDRAATGIGFKLQYPWFIQSVVATDLRDLSDVQATQAVSSCSNYKRSSQPYLLFNSRDFQYIVLVYENGNDTLKILALMNSLK